MARSSTRAKPVRVTDPLSTSLTVFGCGGTGGYLLKHVCRLLYGLKQDRGAALIAPPVGGAPGRMQEGRLPSVLVVDGDTVEAKNLLRQDFIPADLGRKKAAVLAGRVGPAYGLMVKACPHYVNEETYIKKLVPEGGIAVGAVDNAPTRRILHERLSAYDDVVYIDCGNAGVALPEHPQEATREERVAARESGWEGQVSCGVRKGGETIIPFPADVFPNLIEAEEGDLLPDQVPCGQIVASLPQRAMTNLMAATVAMGFLTNLLTDGTLLHHLSFFDARQGYVRSTPAIDQLTEVAA